MLFFTGFTRVSSQIQSANKYSEDIKIANLLKVYSLVDEAEKILTSQESSIDDFGKLLDQAWKFKRQTSSEVTTTQIDEIYKRGIKAGALGGKLLGAGGGGFIVFYVQEEKQPAVMEAMKDLLYIPFKFENSGTQVIYYSPESYIEKEKDIK